MNIQASAEQARNLLDTLTNWDMILQEKRLDAIWGHGCGMDEVKVQTTRKADRMENAIIELQELEERRKAIFEQYWNIKETILGIAEKYARKGDYITINRYVMGCDLSQIPLTGKYKNPQTIVNAAIKRLQAALDLEEEIARQPQAVRFMIQGGTKKCGKCDAGFIKYKEEAKDKFIFECTGCGRRLKADKIKERTKEDEHIG